MFRQTYLNALERMISEEKAKGHKVVCILTDEDASEKRVIFKKQNGRFAWVGVAEADEAYLYHSNEDFSKFLKALKSAGKDFAACFGEDLDFPDD